MPPSSITSFSKTIYLQIDEDDLECIFLLRTNQFWSELFWILIMYCVKVCAIRYFIKTVSLSIEGKDTESCNDAWWRRQMEFDGEFEIEDMFYRGVEC